jgi:putative oxidoreductase
MLEFFGGLAVLLGVFIRPIAVVLAGEMAVAYFQVHYPRSFFPILSGGDTPILFCFIFLFFAAAGASAWSIDAMLSRSRPTASRAA